LHVRTEGQIYRFGPFELDSGRRRLTRGRDQVWLPDRQMDVLVRLVESAGRIVSKDALVEGAWQGLAVTDNTIVQTVRRLRQTLGEQPDGGSYLETSVRQGYRFVASVERGSTASSGDGGLAALAPYLAFVDGSAALETLGRDAVGHARQAFEAVLRADPSYGSAYLGMPSR
jgi:DNA-binding winged helix-turn-helix (wHTH) protein